MKYPFLVKRLACKVVAGKMSPDALDILQPANLHTDMIPEVRFSSNSHAYIFHVLVMVIILFCFFIFIFSLLNFFYYLDGRGIRTPEAGIFTG